MLRFWVIWRPIDNHKMNEQKEKREGCPSKHLILEVKDDAQTNQYQKYDKKITLCSFKDSNNNGWKNCNKNR